MSETKTLVRGAWVAPMCGLPIRDGGVVFVGGRILAVDESRKLQSEHPDAQIIDRSDCTILPGLVNAHTHLELSEFRCGPPPTSFTDWLMQLVPRGQATSESVQESVRRSIPIGMQQCLRFGVTCVGDISRHCAITRPLVRQGPLRVVSFGEIQAMGQRRALLHGRLAAAADQTFASEYLRIGISPHAPYSVEPEGYRRCLALATARNLALATHLAETPNEAAFLAKHAGPFRELWAWIGAWDDEVPTFSGGPIRFAHAVGLLDYPSLLAHVNYCDSEEMELLRRGKASVVYCPRTHAFFGHPPHRWREMMERGINVAIGTDSCASSPDLNLVEELRLLRRIAPDIPVNQLWEMATIRAARAIRMEQLVGALEPGKAADFVMFPMTGGDPLSRVLDQAILPTEIWMSGISLTKPLHSDVS